MTYNVIFSEVFKNDIQTHFKSGNKKLVAKVETLVKELYEHPRSGTGKPEQLKGYNIESWSRRIDSKHRLVYEIYENELNVIAISAYGHYGEK